MKSYKNLYEKMNADEAIARAIYKAAIGKHKRKEVMHFMNDLDRSIEMIHNYITNFENCKHQEIEIFDGTSGKKRLIIEPKFKEHVVHHMVVEALMPMFMKGMYRHSYSSIPGRGLHECMRKIRNGIDHDPASYKYCLKLDIKKFFNSIDHDILKARFVKYIKDKEMLRILFKIIDASENGIPLGFYTSHWFANWLLQPLDHMIKEELHIKKYYRYADDMVLFDSNKRKLHKAFFKIKEWLEGIGLKIKENWQLFRFDYIKRDKETGEKVHKGRPLDFLGFKIYRDRTVLRKSIMLRITRKAKKIKKKGKFTIHDAHQMMAWLGWLDWADCYKMYKKYIKKTITIKECRKRISQYDKKQARLNKFLLKEVESHGYQIQES